MRNLYFVFLVLIGGVSGCSGSSTEDARYIGYSEGRFYNEATHKFKDRFWVGDKSTCLADQDQFDVRLQSINIDSEFEGFLERLTSDKGNEIGIFLTVNKTRRGSDSVVARSNEAAGAATFTSPVERRLVYMSGSTLKGVDISAANLLVYSDTYDGSDYSIVFEVVEFDSDDMNNYLSIAKEMVKAARESGISYNIPYSSLLTSIGTKLFSNVAKDDLIIKYETQLLKCGSVAGDPRSVYFEMGDLVIARVPQDVGRVGWNVKNLDEETKRLNEGSYLLLSIIKRN